MSKAVAPTVAINKKPNLSQIIIHSRSSRIQTIADQIQRYRIHMYAASIIRFILDDVQLHKAGAIIGFPLCSCFPNSFPIIPGRYVPTVSARCCTYQAVYLVGEAVGLIPPAVRC